MKQNIAIIGAGIVGATAAYQLSKRGHNVTVFDDGNGQATKASAGIICPWLSQRRNKDWYKLTAKGADYYPILMEELRSEGVEELPYVRTGALVFKKTEEQLEKLLKIALERREKATLIGEIKKLTPTQIKEYIPYWTGNQGAIWVEGGGKVDGAKLVSILLDLARSYGANIFNEKVKLITKDEDIFVKRSDNTNKQFDFVLACVGAWLPELLNPIGAKVDIRPQKGQLIELDLINNETESWPVCMLHGETDILPFSNGRIIIGATHENDKGYNLENDELLQQSMKIEAQEHLSILSDYEIARTRIGTRAYTSDFLPFFGPISKYPNILVASGLGSSGLTSGAYIGKILGDIVRNKPTSIDIQAYKTDNYIKF